MPESIYLFLPVCLPACLPAGLPVQLMIIWTPNLNLNLIPPVRNGY
jgi:hypothetical protein